MPRKIGFGKDDNTRGARPEQRDPIPISQQPTDQPDPERIRIRRALILGAVLCVMAGLGLYLAIDSLTKGRILGFVFGTMWTVVLVTMGGSRIIRTVLGLSRGRTGRESTKHRWTDDGPRS